MIVCLVHPLNRLSSSCVILYNSLHMVTLFVQCFQLEFVFVHVIKQRSHLVKIFFAILGEIKVRPKLCRVKTFFDAISALFA